MLGSTVVYASAAALFISYASTSAFVAHVPTALSRPPAQRGQLLPNALSPPPLFRRVLGASWAQCAEGGGSTRGARKLSMAFDLGQMLEKMAVSMSGGNGNDNSAGDSGRDVVYDAAIVGYGPAGGVMVSERIVEAECK